MKRDRKIRVAVMMGGVSSERDVSLHSGQGVAAALAAAGFDVVEAVLDDATLGALAGVETDAAFIALHGAFGEDGGVQALLEAAGIPYTGSGPEASRLAMDKVASKALFARAGVLTPDFVVLERRPTEREIAGIAGRLGGTLVVKPSAQGSSIGVSIVEPSELSEAVAEALVFDGRVVVERFIGGRELTVGIVGSEALPVIELRPHHRFFDYDAKYRKGETDYIIKPELPAGVSALAQRAALAAFECLGCRDLARVDMMLGSDGGVYVFEVNTIPGFTETSLVPMAAAATGRDFPMLCTELVEMAMERAAAKAT